MTVSTTAAQTIVQGNGATTSFSFSFIAASADDIEVIYTDTSGVQTTLIPSQYTLVINAPATGQLWGVGGTVTYPIVGSPIANGTSLTIMRIVPLTQEVTISNQGDFAPEVIESALDTLCFELQQIAGRTGQMRGTWVSGAVYNFGDVVVDGANGANTGNYYMCAIANTSSVWATELAAGDWSLVINVQGLSGVNSGTAGNLAYYAATGSVVSGNPNLNVSNGELIIGISGVRSGNLSIAGGTSGKTSLAVASAASGTLTLPAATDTLVGKATTDTLSNKTLTSPTLTGTTSAQVFNISSLTASAAVATDASKNLVSVTNTGSGNNVLSAGPTLTGTTIVSSLFANSINFAGTSLANYFEGTWTPLVIGTATAGTASYSTQLGTYTRIGDRVLVTINLVWSGGTGTGNLRFSGLPIARSGNSSFSFYTNLVAGAGNVLQTFGSNGGTTFDVYTLGQASGTSAQLAYASSGEFEATFTYKV